MPITFHFAARSDVGMVRSNNEDSGYAGPHLLAMADGMGGHAGGDVASSTIIGALVDLDSEALSGVETTTRLIDRITAANAELGHRVDDEPSLAGMGTTLIAMLRARDKLVLAHIGDSRAFLARGGEVTQITKDHSFVQSLVDEGRITSDEAMTHPQRSLVTRVLTGHDDDELDVVVRQANVGDRYVIASDGLTDYVARGTIDDVVLQAPSPEECADELVQLALRAGAPDNVTIVVGDVVDLRTGPAPSDHPQVVGAASTRRTGTRPMPVTPAAKAAALSQEANRDTHNDEDDELHLAEEGPTSRSGRIARILGALLVATVVVAGVSYAGWLWVQRQYWVGVDSQTVAIFRGVSGEVLSISLSQLDTDTTIAVTDLPDHYQELLANGIQVDDKAAAERTVALLRVQAQACRYARTQGQACQTVSSTWTTPSPTPSSTPSGSTSGSPSPSPSAPITLSPAPTPATTRAAGPLPVTAVAVGPLGVHP